MSEWRLSFETKGTPLKALWFSNLYQGLQMEMFQLVNIQSHKKKLFLQQSESEPKTALHL